MPEVHPLKSAHAWKIGKLRIHSQDADFKLALLQNDIEDITTERYSSL